MAKWIEFWFVKDTGKTKVWEVVTIGFGPQKLGAVKWFPRWRKYTFAPQPDTVFEEVCLRDIAEFCEVQTKEHRQKKKAA